MATKLQAAAQAAREKAAAAKSGAAGDGAAKATAAEPEVEKAARKTDVALKKGGALVQGEINFEEDAGAGLEGADKDSFAIPFLAVLQGLSPQLKTVEGAKPGKIINTVTNELFDTIRFVPVAFERRYNRWLPRESGGGFKGTMKVAEVEALIASGQASFVKTDKGEVLMYEDTQLKDTRNHFVLVVDDEGSWSPALLSLASTQIKRSKRLMALIQGVVETAPNGRKFNPASFARIYVAGSESEKNAKGEWESFVFELEGPVADAQLYAAAKKFHSEVSSGSVVVAQPPSGMDEEHDGAPAAGKF